MESISETSHRTSRILRLPEVMKRTGLCRSMVYQLEARRGFPARIKLSERAVGWMESEINAWLKARADQRKVKVPLGRVDQSLQSTN